MSKELIEIIAAYVQACINYEFACRDVDGDGYAASRMDERKAKEETWQKLLAAVSAQESLAAENQKLKRALLLAIPWIGENAEGPSWATPEAKQENRAMCEEAFEAATDCFPEPGVYGPSDFPPG